MLPGRRRDATVERHGHLHQHEGALVLDPAREAFVDAARFGLADAERDVDARRAQAVGAVAGHGGVGIDGGRDHALEARRDQRLCTRPGAAGVIAGLERNVRRASPKAFSGVLRSFIEGNDLGVVEQVVLVPALADDLAGTVEDDAANSGVWRGESDAAAGQFERALHPVDVFFLRVHSTVPRFDSGTKKV